MINLLKRYNQNLAEILPTLEGEILKLHESIQKGFLCKACADIKEFSLG